jgi:hypothetical protein
MTPKLSYNTEMARRILAMTISLPINSDTGLREDTFWLGDINDILVAANCRPEVYREMQETDVLNKRCHPSPKECVEALHWVLEKTQNPIRVMHILAGKYTLYFLQDGDETVSLFEEKHLAFFKDFVGKLSARRRLEIAEEAVRLAERSKNAQLDFLYFARDVLQRIVYELNCPAFHRRNLIVASLETLIHDEEQGVPPDLKCVSTKDIRFGIDRMLGQFPFPPEFRPRIEALRKKRGDMLSDAERLSKGLALLEAILGQELDESFDGRGKSSGER